MRRVIKQIMFKRVMFESHKLLKLMAMTTAMAMAMATTMAMTLIVSVFFHIEPQLSQNKV